MKNAVCRGSRICLLLCAVLLLIMSAACGTGSGASQPSSETTTGADAPDTASSEAEDGAQPGFAIPVLKDKEVFTLTSEDLHDGVWDTVITNTRNGSNESPQLSWEPVDGAECYAVYMVDTSANCWIHWKSNGVTRNALARGWAADKEYIGPYPPEGTHDYEIYVFALGSAPEKLKGAFNSADPKFAEHVEELDGGGNIIAYGHVSGTYTCGD